jgi:hypothetical protein
MPVRDASGRVVVVVPTGMDVTERVRAEQNQRELEAERRRAEALAEIDRSKTRFFSNISQEFRTPLTLILGSLEEMKREAAGAAIPASYLDRMDLVHRNGLRLLKLVNTLLDFSRIEAERVQAVYEATDLAEMTAHLASEFRSAIEKAGLALVVNCPPLVDSAYVDREMWEKIVLNLLSNAFKNPFDGHTLGPVVADMEKLTGVEVRRIHVDTGYLGHNHPHRLRVWISGQVRRVTASIRREMKRRAAVEPVIGHVKAEHRMDRNYLKGRVGDRINAVLAAAGYNFGLLLRWLAELLRAIIRAFAETVPAQKIA